jgi:cytochrome bd-type quinol oxidase subunit 2
VLALHTYRQYPASVLIPILVLSGLAFMIWKARSGKEKLAFAGSCLNPIAMLAGAVLALYPDGLPASSNPASGLASWARGSNRMAVPGGLAEGDFVFLCRMFKGKVQLEGSRQP